MTLKIEPAARATDLGDYAKALDEQLAGPSEQGTLGVPGGGASGGGAEPEAPTMEPEALVPLVEIIGALATDPTGTSRLTEKECSRVADALAPVLDKHAGDFFERFSEELALAMVLSVVAWPRVREVRSRNAAESKASADSVELAAGRDEPKEAPE